MNPRGKIQNKKLSKKSNRKMDSKTTAVSNTDSTERKKWINQNREEYDQFIERKRWVNQNKEEYDQYIYGITSDQLYEKARSRMKLQKKEV